MMLSFRGYQDSVKFLLNLQEWIFRLKQSALSNQPEKRRFGISTRPVQLGTKRHRRDQKVAHPEGVAGSPDGAALVPAGVG
jgi:hypothetical protein